MWFGGGTGVRAEGDRGKSIVVGRPVMFCFISFGRGRPITFERRLVLNANLSSVNLV